MTLAFTTVQRIGATRLVIGLLQGIVLYLLSEAASARQWPATDAPLFKALVAAAFFVPLIAVASVGNLRPRTLTAWIALAAILCLGLAFYSSYRILPPADVTDDFSVVGLVAILTGLLFICHALIAAGDADRRLVATFPTYFDVAWKLGTQTALACLFVGVFWGVLLMGVGLFSLIKIGQFADLIQQPWFLIPATTAAASLSFHLTDAGATLLRGARALVLGMLSWLMPVMTAIVVAFLVALPFTGLQAFWGTRLATASLLAATAILVLLINSHFQDGGPESTVPPVLVHARLVAAVALTPLVVLAAIGLGLRVEQYGWTPSRILTLAFVVAAGCHALGYTIAALRSGLALRGLPETNVISAFVMVTLMLALMTPLADPARLSVASQVARLEAGSVAVNEFDFDFLRYRSGRFGISALDALKGKTTGPNAAAIAAKATEAASRPHRGARPASTQATPASRAADIVVVQPAGGALPQRFIETDWRRAPANGWLPACLTTTTQGRQCQALLIDLTDDGKPEIVLIDGSEAVVFREAADGSWAVAGRIRDNLFCGSGLSALRSGKAKAIQPAFKAIEANGQILQITTPCQ